MYCEWASLSSEVQNCGEIGQSVLNKFTPGSGKEVVLSVIKQLTSNLGITHPPEPSKLAKDNEVTWCMEVSIIKTNNNSYRRYTKNVHGCYFRLFVMV